LLVAFTAAALTGYVQTRKAYTGAREALARAEATSRLSLEVLEGIYLQLSPDRVWISSDADPGGDACACIGLRPGAGGASSAGHPSTQVPVSNQTAALLENLLVFYDRLAEQAGDDFPVMLEAAIASRRVGDIRQRLGQLEQAEREYLAAIEKLTALSSRPDSQLRVRTELARAHNELGSVRSARLEAQQAYGSHRKALSVIETSQPGDQLPEEYRYELARTYYFLANKHPGAPTNRRDAAAAPPGPHRYSSAACRKAAIGILEGLARDYPEAADYRFLLALCHRPSGSGPDPAGSPIGERGRGRAIEILEGLKAEYPGVVDYRYELTVTYAWIHVGLFPWQEPSAHPSEAEQSLAKALDESQWLVDHHPAVPHYAASQALILAKLGTVCWRTGRLPEAEDFLHKALDTQSTVIAKFPDLPAHNRVVLEFLRLRLAEVHYEHGAGGQVPTALDEARDLLQTCIENLSQLVALPELADDRLAWTSLPVAYDTLSRVLADVGDQEKAEEARQAGDKIRSTTPDGRRYPWAQ
jgi:tetratricopeptide (TPR) repeat protein